MYMNRNALLYDNLTADEMNILLSELKDRFPDIAVATQHQKDWQLSYQEAMEYIDSVDEDYDPPNYLRKNWPSEPMVAEQIDFFKKSRDHIDVNVNFNSSFLWMISFWYYWSIDFIAFSYSNYSETIVEKLHDLAVHALDSSHELERSYGDNWLFGPFDDMDAVGLEVDFYLVANMGGDEPFRPILFCKHSKVVEFLKNHPVFIDKCDYFSREEYLKDPVLNPERLPSPPPRA